MFSERSAGIKTVQHFIQAAAMKQNKTKKYACQFQSVTCKNYHFFLLLFFLKDKYIFSKGRP